MSVIVQDYLNKYLLSESETTAGKFTKINGSVADVISVNGLLCGCLCLMKVTIHGCLFFITFYRLGILLVIAGGFFVIVVVVSLCLIAIIIFENYSSFYYYFSSSIP